MTYLDMWRSGTDFLFLNAGHSFGLYEDDRDKSGAVTVTCE